MKPLLLALAASSGAVGASPAPVAPPCSVEGSRAPADVEWASAACRVARGRFQELFGGPAPDVRVVLWERPAYRTGVQGGRAVIFWPTSESMEAREARAEDPEGYTRLQWEEVLPHEIAHVLLAARFWATGHRAAAPGNGYATPFPDWLDEAVAIWAEPASARRGRLGEARELPEDRRELARILVTPHPATTDPAVLAMRDGRPAPQDPDLRAFYPQAIAVLGFVFDAGGPVAMRELAERLVTDPWHPNPLLGLPGLEDDPVGLEARWVQWLTVRSETSLASR